MKTESRLPRLVSSPPANVTVTSPPKSKKLVVQLELENDEGKLRHMWQEESDEDVKRLIRKRMYTLREERVSNHGGLKQPQATAKSPNKNGTPTTSAKTTVRTEVKTTSSVQNSPRSGSSTGSGSKLPRFATASEQKTKRTTVTSTTTLTSPTKPKQSKPSPSAIPTRTPAAAQDSSVKRKKTPPESKLRSPTRFGSPTKTKVEKIIVSSPEPDTPESPVDMAEYLGTVGHPEDFSLTPEPSFEELEDSFRMRTDDTDSESPDFSLVEDNSRDEFEIRQTYRTTTVQTKKVYMQHADSLKEFEMVEKTVLQDDREDFFNTSDTVDFHHPQVTMPDDDTDYPVHDIKVRVDDEDRVIIEELDAIQSGTLVEDKEDDDHFGVADDVQRSQAIWKDEEIVSGNLSHETITKEPVIVTRIEKAVFVSAPVEEDKSIPYTKTDSSIPEEIVKRSGGSSPRKVESFSYTFERSVKKEVETPESPVKKEHSSFKTIGTSDSSVSVSSKTVDVSEHSVEERTRIPDAPLKKEVVKVELDVKEEVNVPEPAKVSCELNEVHVLENSTVMQSSAEVDFDTVETSEADKVDEGSFVTKMEEFDVPEYSVQNRIDIPEPSSKTNEVTVVLSVKSEQEPSDKKEFAESEPSSIKKVTTSETLVKKIVATPEYSSKEESVSPVISPKKTPITPESLVKKEWVTLEPSTITKTVTTEYLVTKEVETPEPPTTKKLGSPVTSPKKGVVATGDYKREVGTVQSTTVKKLVKLESFETKEAEDDLVAQETSPKKEVITIVSTVKKVTSPETPSVKNEAVTQSPPVKKETDIQVSSWKKEADTQVPSWKKEPDTQVPSWKKEPDAQAPSGKKEPETQPSWKKEADISVPSEKKEADTQLPWKKPDTQLPSEKAADVQVPSEKKEADIQVPSVKKEADIQVPSVKKEADVQVPYVKKEADVQVPSWKKEPDAYVSSVKKESDIEVPSWKKESDTQLPSGKKETDTQLPSGKKETDTQLLSGKKEPETQVPSWKKEPETQVPSWKKEPDTQVPSIKKEAEPFTLKRIIKTEFTVKTEVNATEPVKKEVETADDSEKRELDAERKKVFDEARAKFAAANRLLESSDKSPKTVLPVERKKSYDEARAKFSSLASKVEEGPKIKPIGRFTEVTRTTTTATTSETSSYPVSRWSKPVVQETQPSSLEDSKPYSTFIVKRTCEDVIPEVPVNGNRVDANVNLSNVSKADILVAPDIPDAKVTATITLSPSKVSQEHYRTYTVKKIRDDPFEKTPSTTPTTISNETSKVYYTPTGRVTEVTHTTITSSTSSGPETTAVSSCTLELQKPPPSPTSPTKSPTGFPWRNQEGAIGALVKRMSSQDVTAPPVMVTQKTYVTRTSSSTSDKVIPVEDWQAIVQKRKMGLAAERAKEDENLLYTTAAMAPEDIHDMGLLEKMLNAASNYEQRRRIRAQMRVVKKNQEAVTSADRDATCERVVVQSRDYPKQLRSSFSSFTSASSGYSSASPSPDRERSFSPLTPDGAIGITGSRNFQPKPEIRDLDESCDKLSSPDDSVTDDSGYYASSQSEQGDAKVSPFLLSLSDNNMADMYVSGVNLNDVHDEVHLHELLDSTEDYEDRKKIRARLKDVMAYNRGQREEMIRRREEEREEMLKSRVRDAEEQKRRTLAMYDAMAKSAPAGGHKTMDVNILRDEMQDVKENLLPSITNDVHEHESSSLSCWQLIKSVQTEKVDKDGSHVVTTNACWSYKNGKGSGPSTPTLPDGKLDMVEEGIRQRVRESDERKKKILAAYDQAAKSGPAGAPRFVDFDNVNIENFDPQQNPPRFTSTVQIKGGIPITGNTLEVPVVGPVHPKAHGYDPMEEAIRKRQREADERKRRTLEAYDKAQKSRPAGTPVSVYIPQADDVEPVVEILGRQQRAPTGPQFKPMGGGAIQQQQHLQQQQVQQKQQQQSHTSVHASIQLKAPPAPPPKATLPPQQVNQQQKNVANLRAGAPQAPPQPNAHHTVQQRVTVQQQQQQRQQQQYSRREYYEEEEEEEEEEDEDDY